MRNLLLHRRLVKSRNRRVAVVSYTLYFIHVSEIKSLGANIIGDGGHIVLFFTILFLSYYSIPSLQGETKIYSLLTDCFSLWTLIFVFNSVNGLQRCYYSAAT